MTIRRATTGLGRDVDFNRLLQEVGLPATALAVVCWLVVRASKVAWADAFIPFRDRGLARIERFFDKLESILDESTDRYHETRQQAERHEDLTRRMFDELLEVKDLCVQTAEATGSSGRPRKRKSRRWLPPQDQPDPGASPTSPGTPSSPSTS